MLTLVAAHLALAAALPPLSRHAWFRGPALWAVAALPPLAALGYALAHAGPVLDGRPVTSQLSWAPALGLRFGLRLDALALLMVCVVSGVGALVLAYAAAYYREQRGREAGLLLAFSGAMLGLVLADNVFVLYVFWELTTVASFALIAGRDGGEERHRAAGQALLVTTGGGLAMLLGLVLLAERAGSYSLAAIVADPPSGGAVTAALALILTGALAKSAQFPLHGWLPAAMVAPTPVSAYLHAAAMVKAGVYLVARLSPGFADAAPWRPVLLAVGTAGLVIGAWRALRETDLKRLLAYSTISELGLLLVLFGAGTRTGALAGAAMLLAHALFKAALFMITGLIDHATGTRDLRLLSGLAGRLPGALAAGALAAASMAGVPPLLGFLAEDAGFDAFLHGEVPGEAWVLAGLVAGSALKAANAARFLWGAFARKPERARTPEPAAPAGPGHAGAGLLLPAAVLAALSAAAGLWTAPVADLVVPYADALPHGAGAGYELKPWHGLTVPLALTAVALAGGAALHLGRGPLGRLAARLPRLPDAQRGYSRTLKGVRITAIRVTRATQVGSLPVYLTAILLTVVLLPGVPLLGALAPVDDLTLWWSVAELPLAAVVLGAAAAAALTRQRMAAVLLTGAAGYGVGAFFFVEGAVDLALTQFLVESLTLVVMVLVLRRLPPLFTPVRRDPASTRWVRPAVAAAVGVFATLFALTATHARQEPALSEDQVAETAKKGGGNVVDSVISDYRALDTLGEISVVFVTGVGVISLVRVWRGRGAGPAPARPALGPARPPRRAAVGLPGFQRSPAAHWDEPRAQWLPGAAERPAAERSVLLEVAARPLFFSILVLAVYLLVAGHDRFGGGFAAGLVAGQAFVLRFLVGGRADLGLAVPIDPGVLAGGGLAAAALVETVPLALGKEPLTSATWTAEVPVIGTVEASSGLLFETGVFVLVTGVILKLLAASGVAAAHDQRLADEAAASPGERHGDRGGNGEGQRG